MATTYDLAIFQPPAKGISVYTQALATSAGTGRYITGIEKLAQRFIIELMTQQGSMQFAQPRGSVFVERITQGNIISELDLATAFGIAMLKVRSNLISEESNADPDDERFVGAELTSVQVGTDRIGLTIQITNRAGTVGILNLPISINLQTQEVVGS